jgi:hypothetical protein
MRPSGFFPVAILCSDIHLRHKAPIARSGEPDWYAAMARPLLELEKLAHTHRVPIVCAGDIFHKWDSPPELINWAIDHLPVMYAIPGQHDLPLHNYADIAKSAYWTLVKAGKVLNLTDKRILPSGDVCVYAFPWGKEVHSITPSNGRVDLAVIHAYVWREKFGYAGAPEPSKASRYASKLKGYTAAVFGDNHQGFYHKGTTPIINCGGLMRSTTDDIHRDPSIWILYGDGGVVRHPLDTSKDILTITPEVREAEKIELSDFITELEGLGIAALEVTERIKQILRSEIPKEVKSILVEDTQE